MFDMFQAKHDRVDAEVFRKILDICPRVKVKEFTELQNDDDTLTFLIDLGYKGPLHKYTNMYVDHMSQPWRTLTTIINKCLFGKTTSNDRIKKSRIGIMWGMFYRENFVRIGEDYQEYGLAIPDVMLNDAIKQSESYQMFIKYSTSQIPPKKSRGKGSQGKKTVDDSQETVDVSEESEPEPEPVKKKTASRRVVKKKVTISADDNIIPDPDVALELGKSISLAEAEEEEAAKQVHATHARIVTESVPESAKKKTGSRSSRSVVIQDTPSAPKPKPATSKPKLKGVQSLTPAKKEAADIMQALKESKKTSKRQPGTRGSSEGTGTIPGVPDKSIVVSATLNEGTDTKPGVLDEEKVITEEKIILKWGSKQESKYSEEDQLDDEEKDDKEGDDEDAEIESDEDEIYKYKIRVRKDKDVEMINAKVEDSEKAELPPTSSSLSVSSGFGDQFLKLSFDNSLVSTVKDNIDAEINSLLEVKIQYKVPYIQSPSVPRVPVSVISEPTVLIRVQKTSSAAPVTTLPLPSVSTTPHVPQQTTTPIPTPPITTETPTITTVVPESDTLTAVQLRVAKLEKDVSELKNIDHSAETIATLKSQVPTVVDDYLGSKLGSEKSGSKILKIKREQAEKQKMPKYTIKSTDKATLKKYDQKSALYQTMQENESFNRNSANHKLYHALMEALIEDENARDKGVADTVKDHKRKHDDDDDDDEDPPAGPNQGKKTKRSRTKESKSSKKTSTTKETPKGKAPSKGSKTGKSAFAKELVEEPIAEVVMDDASEDVFRDDDQPQDAYKLDWNNQEGERYPFDLSKPLPLQGHPGHLTVVADYLFNNDLEYLKSSNPERTYTTSITKTKVARYEIMRIEDMVLAFGMHLEEIHVSWAFREEIDETTDLHQHLSRLCSQRLESASQDTRDAVTIHPTTVSLEFMTTSACKTQPKI
ncbi:hypothetical protein Tco_0776360 [Tanacetum coccineum]